jgi:E3 ubiquitin-protein ligase MYCBP2
VLHIVLCFRLGILDVFLSCVAKALTVQVKVKGKDASGGKGLTTVTLATTIHPRDFVGSRWWLRWCITRKLAEVIIQLMKDMAAVSKRSKLDFLCTHTINT